MTNQSEDKHQPIVYFQIDRDLTIKDIYTPDKVHPPYIKSPNESSNDDDLFRWSFDVSNLQEHDNGEYLIFVAVSYINIGEDMKGSKNHNSDHLYKEQKENVDYKKVRERKFEKEDPLKSTRVINIQPNQKGTVIYSFRLDQNYVLKDKFDHKCCYYYNVSGIPKFIEASDPELKRFIILNFNGIYNFKYNNENRIYGINERFEYPNNLRVELDHWHTGKSSDCMNRLLACLYDKYFLVEKYNNNVQVLEGKYDLKDIFVERNVL